MTPLQLRTLVAVVHHGSFSAAAEALHVTQPAVSKRIRQLEEALGCDLLIRLGGNVRPTDAGRRLLGHAERLLLEFEDIETELRNLSGAVAGSLAVATSHHIGLHRLPPLLRDFNQRHQQVRLEIQFVDSEESHQLLTSGAAELAIVTLNPAGDTRLHQIHLWTDPLLFMAAPDHPLADRDEPLELEELLEFPAVLPDMATFTGRIIVSRFAEAGLQIEPTMATNYLETVRMLAGVGLGWTVLPATMLDASLAALAVDGSPLARELGYITNPARPLSNAARAMVDLLESYGDVERSTPI